MSPGVTLARPAVQYSTCWGPDRTDWARTGRLGSWVGADDVSLADGSHGRRAIVRRERLCDALPVERVLPVARGACSCKALVLTTLQSRSKAQTGNPDPMHIFGTQLVAERQLCADVPLHWSSCTFFQHPIA